MTKKFVDVWMSSEKKPGDMKWYFGPSNITYKLEEQESIEITDKDNSVMTTININPGRLYQSILGVGTSIEESTVSCLSRMSWEKRHEVLEIGRAHV